MDNFAVSLLSIIVRIREFDSQEDGFFYSGPVAENMRTYRSKIQQSMDEV